MSNLLLLPVDILINIFKKLTLPDLRNIMLTCKTLSILIVNDNTIWRTVCRDRLIINSKLQLSAYNRSRISQNWCNGYYRSKVLMNHYINYMPTLEFYRSQILLLSVGSELHCYQKDRKGLPNCRDALWRLNVPKIRRQDVRTNDISRFVIKQNVIACGNRDGCVAVYKCHDIYDTPKLLCHIEDCHDEGRSEVNAVELIRLNDRTVVITGSNDDSSLLFYHLADEIKRENDRIQNRDYINDSTYIPVCENAGIRCLALNKTMDKLAIGLNGSQEPILLDVDNTKLLMTSGVIKNAKHVVRDIRWHNENTITYVTHSGMLGLIDIRTHEVVYKVRDPFQSTLYCVKSDGENAIVVGSAEYSRCVLFDSRNPMHHVQMYFTQRKTSPVYSLDFDSTKLITAVDRGVAVLNFNVDIKTVEQRDYSHVFR